MAIQLENRPTASDRRDALRLATRPKAVMIVHPDYGEKAAVLIDISRSGMRLRTRTGYPCGGEIHVLPPSHFNLQPVRARIVRMELQDADGEETFDLGVELHDESGDIRHQWFLALREMGGQ